MAAAALIATDSVKRSSATPVLRTIVASARSDERCRILVSFGSIDIRHSGVISISAVRQLWEQQLEERLDIERIDRPVAVQIREIDVAIGKPHRVFVRIEKRQ